jgi:hypothetical protein
MPKLHKLAEGPLTMVVTSATEVEGKFGAQVLFSDGTFDVYISESSASRGLARISHDLQTIIGETVTFSQIKKDSKTYTNIDLGDVWCPTPDFLLVADATPRTPAGRAPSMSLDEIEERYAKCLDIAVRVFVNKCDGIGLAVDAAALQAATATLLIQAGK